MRTIVIALASLCVAAAPAMAEAWLTVAGADDSFRLDMPIPFDMPPTEIKPDGSITFSYVYAAPGLVLRLEVVESAARDSDAVAAGVVHESTVEHGATIRQTQEYVIGRRTYRLVATSIPGMENDPTIVRFLGSMRVSR